MIPFIDLHCHFDGSLPWAFIVEAEKKRGNNNLDFEELKNRVSVGRTCTSLSEYLTKFDYPIELLCTAENIENAAKAFIKESYEAGIKYIEIRFSPALLTGGGMSDEKVLESAIKGFTAGALNYDVDFGVIVCAMRNHSLEENKRAFYLAKNFESEGVVGLDLAGDESRYPTSDFKELFSYAKELNLPFTIHAGETGSPQSVRDAIEFGASRIGHGIAMASQPALMECCKNLRVGVEMCPISNYQTRSVQAGDEYPIKKFLDYGLLVSVNTDNRTVSDTSLGKEFEFLENHGLIHDCDKTRLLLNAIETSFAKDEVKNKLLMLLK